MISTGDFKKGLRVEIEGEPWVVLDVSSQSPTARGGATLIKTKLRNLLSGAFIARTFKAGEKFGEPDLEFKAGEYLYKDDAHWVFMDQETYEQYHLSEAELGDALSYLVDNLEVRIQFFNSRPIGIELPNTMVLEVAECEPAVRGDTVNAVTKAAKLVTGLVVQVPMFVERGERIKIDTREARYIERAR